jgi:hypothetical protein
VFLLIDCVMLCRWPECVFTKGVGLRCFILVAVLFPTAVCAGVVDTNRVVAMGVAISAHVAWFLILGASAFKIATACVGIDVLTVVALVCHLGNGCRHLIDFCFHRCNFLVACVFAANLLLAPLLAIC